MNSLAKRLFSVLPLAFSLTVCAQTYEVLVSSSGDTPPCSGGNPQAGLIQGFDGSLYGDTYLGGRVGAGTVLRVTTNGVCADLWSFSWSGCDGGYPEGNLIQATDGNLYGTTSCGTSNGCGAVFQLTTNGSLANLHFFSRSGGDGFYPQAGLVQAWDGALYGMTPYGGLCDSGTVFRVTTNGDYMIVHSFDGSDEGTAPQAGLIQGGDGDLYGTTFEAGEGYGTVFKMTTNGTLTTLHAFSPFGAEGANPSATLLQGWDGRLYGTTLCGGGAADKGVVFALTTNGVYTTLHSFTGPDGDGPLAGLVQASDGNLYGTACYGGASGVGTVFRVTTNGSYTLLHSFSGTDMPSADGGNPLAALVQAIDGNLYGTTKIGGPSGGGVVFRLDMTPPSIRLSVLGLNKGSFSVLATGLKGNGPIILYGSADLLNWQPISTNAPASGSATFEAPCTANQRCGFYRIQEE